MLFEDFMLMLLLAAAIFFIGIPIFRFIIALIPKRRNPLKEAKERLNQVRVEIEAAKLNKECEKLYSELYDETLKEEEKKNGKL